MIRRASILLALALAACGPASRGAPATVQVAPATTGHSTAEPPEPPAAPKPVLVIDFGRADARAAVPADVGRPLLQKLYPRFHATADGCIGHVVDHDGDLAAARAAGDFAPVVTSRVVGAFTGPQPKQTVVVIARGECNATHADGYGTKELVVLEDGAPVLRVDVDFSAVEVARDFDRDGVDELVVSSGDSHMGYTVVLADVISVRGGTFAQREALGQVYEDDCGLEAPSIGVRATKVWFDGERLVQQLTNTPCPAPPP